MPLSPIKLRPGIDTSGTDYSNEGGYYACDKVRFRAGKPQKIGGWVKYLTSEFVGTCRGLFNWATLNGTNILAVATNVKYYLESNGGLYDITPVRTTATLTTSPFSAELGSSVMVVSHSNHGAATGDYVTFTGATAFAGVSATELNKEFTLETIDANSYRVTLAVAAAATDSGGGTPSAAYQINTTPNVAMPGRGWGAGKWGRGAWGSAAESATFTTLRLWSQESFGENHVFCPRNGALYYWNFSLGLASGNRAIAMSDLPGASDVPLMATKLIMSTQDRHLIALGTNAIGDTEQDPLLIRWADTESVTNWTPAITNAAGDLRCSSGNYIVTAVRLKKEILIFTDGSIFSLQFIGAPDIFGMEPTADNISITSPQAVAVVNNAAYWMGNDKFYVYNGRVDPLFCTLQDDIFKDLNRTQSDQIHCGTNEGFSEIWWFYCSAGSSVIDRYVVYNYEEKVWYNGTMHRTAWLDTPLKKFPVAASGQYLYRHEEGSDDDRITPIHAWIESSDFDIDSGEHFSFVDRLLPDITFVGSTASEPALNISLVTKDAPGGGYRQSQSKPVERTTDTTVEEYTTQCDLRLRARQMKIKIESTALGVHWKLGIPRIDIRPDGKK